MRDGRLQQRGQAPVSYLHQTGHPGLVLLLSGRRLRRRRRRRTPSASLPASPRGRSGRTPPLPIGAECASSPHPAPAPFPPPAVLGPSRPGPRGAHAGAGRARPRPCGLEAEADLPRVGPLPSGAAWRDRFPRRIFCRGRGCQVCRLPGTGGHTGGRGPPQPRESPLPQLPAGLWCRVAGGSRAGSHSGP